MPTMYRVTTIMGGPYVQGGGIQQFYFDLAGGTAAQACTAAKTFWSAFAASVGSATTFATNAAVEVIQDTDGAIVGVSTTTAGTTTGTGGTEVLPMATQGLVQWRTGVYSDGREIRGRTNIPAMLEAGSSAGVPTSATQTAIAAAGAALIADANSSLVVYRRPRLARPQVGNPGDPWYLPAQTARDGEFAAVSTATASTKWAILRGRRD
jgi:hypothetical protein